MLQLSYGNVATNPVIWGILQHLTPPFKTFTALELNVCGTLKLNSSTLIDHFWTNRPEMYNDCGVLPFLSDHSLLYVVRRGKRSSKGCFKYVKARSYKTFDESAFLADLQKAPWEQVESYEDPNAAWETFLSLFDPICNRHAPFKNTKIPCNPPPWLDSDYIELRN